METPCLLRDSIKFRWGYDNQYYCPWRLNDGNGCSSSLSNEVLEGLNKDSKVQRVSQAKWAGKVAKFGNLKVWRNM